MAVYTVNFTPSTARRIAELDAEIHARESRFGLRLGCHQSVEVVEHGPYLSVDFTVSSRTNDLPVKRPLFFE
jgi:hypothetical protein